jgi:hypothetical protein
MANCSNCGAPLEQLQKFCGTCGTPAAKGKAALSAPPPSIAGGGTKLMAQQTAQASPPPNSAKTDPFAQTVLGDSLDNVPRPSVKPSVSPMAASVWASPSVPAPASGICTPPPPAAPQVYRSTPPAAPGYGPGAVVLVRWGDGKQYQGKVIQAQGKQALIAFSNGAQHWIDVSYLSQAGP